MKLRLATKMSKLVFTELAGMCRMEVKMSLQRKKTGCTREATHEENGCAGLRTANSSV